MASQVAALRRLFGVQLLLFVREPIAVFFTLLFPLMLVVILGYSFGRFHADAGYLVSDEQVPVLIAMTIATVGLMGLPVTIAEYRAQGILKRYRTSPISLGRLLPALVAANFTVFLAAAALTVALTWLLFGLRFSGNVIGVAVLTVLAAAAVFAVGVFIGGFVRTARTAQAVGLGTFFPMLFLSGAMIPRAEFPAWLRRIGDFIPMTYAVDGLVHSWIGQGLTTQWRPALVLVAMFALASAATARTFRWS